MSKSLRSFDDIPQDIRNNVLGVIEANHINFDPAKMTGGVRDVFDFTEEENTNGRLGYNGDTCSSTYRVPDYNGFRVYVNQPVSDNGNHRALVLVFYDKGIGRSDYIYIEIDRR